MLRQIGLSILFILMSTIITLIVVFCIVAYINTFLRDYEDEELLEE